ncbi:MAG: element excision factor XisH family protein [Crocosphaera sp.]|nr:element excision factor XisH family protein [Crocosphaera sp.]
MPAKDIYHDTVITALQKDGWLTKSEVRSQKSEVVFVTRISLF